MKDLYYQTKQAFLFSLVFYLVSLVLFLFKVGLAPILFSVSLLISLIWVFLVLREIIFSRYINNAERIILALFIIITNIFGGLIYFFLLRGRVINKNIYKK